MFSCLVLALQSNSGIFLRSELGTIFCLPWAITWFGHVLNDYEVIVRLFDVFIFSHPWTSMYLSAVIVLHRAREIFLTPCEMPLLHQTLSNVLFYYILLSADSNNMNWFFKQIPDDLPFDILISETEKLMKTYPPEIIEEAVRQMHIEKYTSFFLCFSFHTNQI